MPDFSELISDEDMATLLTISDLTTAPTNPLPSNISYVIKDSGVATPRRLLLDANDADES